MRRILEIEFGADGSIVSDIRDRGIPQFSHNVQTLLMTVPISVFKNIEIGKVSFDVAFQNALNEEMLTASAVLSNKTEKGITFSLTLDKYYTQYSGKLILQAAANVRSESNTFVEQWRSRAFELNVLRGVKGQDYAINDPDVAQAIYGSINELASIILKKQDVDSKYIDGNVTGGWNSVEEIFNFFKGASQDASRLYRTEGDDYLLNLLGASNLPNIETKFSKVAFYLMGSDNQEFSIAIRVQNSQPNEGDYLNIWSLRKTATLPHTETAVETGWINLNDLTNIQGRLDLKSNATNLTNGSEAGSLQQKFNTASGDNSLATGYKSTSSGFFSHAEGAHTLAKDTSSHAEGEYTRTSRSNQHVNGQFNADNPDAIAITGNGDSEENRKNATETMFDGRFKVHGVPKEADDTIRKAELDALENGKVKDLEDHVQRHDQEISNEAAARASADSALSSKIGENATGIKNEAAARTAEDSIHQAHLESLDKRTIDLQTQLDGQEAKGDANDVVSNKAELNKYDTSQISTGYVVKVLADESKQDATTYYKWDGSKFVYTGKTGRYRTVAEQEAIDAELRAEIARKQDTSKIAKVNGEDITNGGDIQIGWIKVNDANGGSSKTYLELQTDGKLHFVMQEI